MLASSSSWMDAGLVIDGAGRVVARLPVEGQDEIVTARGAWRVEMRRGSGWSSWEFAVGPSRRGEAAASGRPSLAPRAYRLRIGRTATYRLSNRWIGNDWRVRAHRKRRTVIDIEKFGSNVWSLDVAAGIPQAHLPLLVPLAVLMVQADLSLPWVEAAGAGS